MKIFLNIQFYLTKSAIFILDYIYPKILPFFNGCRIERIEWIERVNIFGKAPTLSTFFWFEYLE